VGPIGSAALTFMVINKQTNRQAKYILDDIAENRF